MLNKILKLLSIVFFALCSNVFAQEEGNEPPIRDTLDQIDTSSYVHFFNEVDPFDEFKPEEEEKDFKKKKPKKKVFYGIKTKKGFTKHGYGSKEVLEVFYYIPYEETPVPYVKDVYFFDTKHFKIDRGRKKLDPQTSRLLHGPYKKVIQGNIMETGVYYKGVKHARWEKYSKPKTTKFKDTIEVEAQYLISKDKYNRGWPKGAELTYWDVAKKKLKEAKPLIDDDLNGYYVRYYEGGRMAMQGNYIYNYKAGTWISYFDKGKRTAYRHFLIKFPRNPLLGDGKGKILKEWSEEGKLLYDYEKEKKAKRGKLEPRMIENSPIPEFE